MTDTHACVLCAARGRERQLEDGHCCPACAQRVLDHVAALPRLAAAATAATTPAQGTGTGSGAYGSRPPVDLDAVQAELLLVELNAGDPSSSVTILAMCEMWERAIREDRSLVPYGLASAARRDSTTLATLASVCRFLAAQHEWVTAEPTFGLEDYADQMRRAAGVLRRFDPDAEPKATVIACPTLTESGECGYRLRYTSADETVTCRRCGASRDTTTLIAVAMSDGRPVWMDPENAAAWLGVSEATLMRKARKGDIVRAHGRYLVRSILTSEPMTATM